MTQTATRSQSRVELIGTLQFQPEVREIAKGRKVARLSLMTSDSYKDFHGEWVTNTAYHTVVAWGQTAEMVDRLLRKDMPIAMDGRLVHRCYEMRDGSKRYVTEVVMSSFQLLPKLSEA